jgi:hypothetical protein
MEIWKFWKFWKFLDGWDYLDDYIYYLEVCYIYMDVVLSPYYNLFTLRGAILKK